MDTSNLSQYDDETAVERLDEQRVRGQVSSAWNIGDNPNGGYLVSLITRALAQEAPSRGPGMRSNASSDVSPVPMV